MGVKDIIDIETVSKFDRQYVSFCVTVASKSDADLIYFHTWRSGIVVEPSKIHAKRLLRLNNSTSSVPHTGIKNVSQRKRHLAPRLRRSLQQSKSESSMLRGSTALAADYRHTRRGKATTDEPSRRESSASTTTPQPVHQATSPTPVQQGAPSVASSSHVQQTVHFPHNPMYSPITPDHQRAPLRESSLSMANPSNSQRRESTSGVHHGHRRTTPTTTPTIHRNHPYSHLNAPQHRIVIC